MTQQEYTLIFSLQDPQEDPGVYVSDLHAHGCDDALLGIGKKGRIALNFIRDTSDVQEDMNDLVELIEHVIPGAQCVERRVGADDEFLVLDA